MSAKNPVFKILRCPGCGKQNWHTEPLSSIPPCPKCGGQPKYSTDWYIKVLVDGKRHIQAIGRQKQHAESALKKAEAEIFYDEYKINQQHPLLSQAITNIYNEKWRKKKDGEGTQRRAELLQAVIGDIPINIIGEKHMKILATELAKRGTGDSTANRYRSVLRAILRFHKLPYDFINMDPEIEGRIRVITDEEEKQILELFRKAKTTKRRGFYTEMPDLCICLADTGMRANELLQLPPKDVNFATGMITCWENKADKPRSVPMTKRVRRILTERIEQIESKKEKLKEEGKPDPGEWRLFDLDIYQADNAWSWVRKEMNLDNDSDFVLHAWRHTCATRLLIAGVDVFRVKEWLGHKSIKTTMRYLHLAPHNLKDALKLLENR